MRKFFAAKKKRKAVSLLLAAVLTAVSVYGTGDVSMLPVNAEEPAAVAYTGGLCEHHTAHDKECGYQEAVEEEPCNHEHTEACYPEGNEPSEGEEPDACTHECSETNGCITKKLDCQHEHDEACGYQEAVEEKPCKYVCEICSASTADGGSTEFEPECTCEMRCTEDNRNTGCPVCGAEGADVSACTGEEKKETPVCNCTEKCTEENVNKDCPVCGEEDANLSQCKGAGAENASPSDAAALSAEAVQALIDALPTAEQLKAMSLEEQQIVYADLQTAYDAYEALTDEQKTEIEGAEIFDALFAVFSGTVNTLDAAGVTYIAYTWDEDSKTLTQASEIATAYTTINENMTRWDGSTTNGVYVAEGSVNIGLPVTVSGDVKLILKDNATLICNMGISVAQGGALSIYAQSTGETTMGSVNAAPGDQRAAIAVGASGTINIHGGKVTANGGYASAGIGGGNGASGGTISIYGGKVTANGGYDGGAAIGGGRSGASGTISINGGMIEATGSNVGAGIGCGMTGTAGSITINGGTVEATGGSNAAGIGGKECMITINGESTKITAKSGTNGAGIGGGSLNSSSTITINGGTVEATGGSNAAGIGGGSNTYGGKITINGGTVTVTGGGSNAADIGGGEAFNGGTGVCDSITILEGATVKTADGGTPYIGPYHGADTETWTSDATDHWHPCMIESCTDISHQYDKASHSYGADRYESGELVSVCTICDTPSVYALDSIVVDTQPLKLTYNGGDQLDLSGLKIEAIFYKGAESKTLILDYDSTGVTCSPAHDTVLNADHNGTSITITFGGKTTTTNQLTVNVDSESYPVTVNGGTGSGDYEVGETVNITANPPTGKVFTGWKVTEGNVTLADAGSATTTFTMPAEAVTVEANYKNSSKPTPKPEQTLTSSKSSSSKSSSKSPSSSTTTSTTTPEPTQAPPPEPTQVQTPIPTPIPTPEPTPTLAPTPTQAPASDQGPRPCQGGDRESLWSI